MDGQESRMSAIRNAAHECSTGRVPLGDAMIAFEWACIDEALVKTTHGGRRNVSAAARRLGIHRNTLIAKLKKVRPMIQSGPYVGMGATAP